MDVLKVELASNGCDRILVMQDYLTKYLCAFPMKNEKAETVAKVLVHDVFPSLGVPAELLTDRGANFTSKLMKELARVYDIDRVVTTAAHPQSDGMVERANRTLLAAIAKVINDHGGEWTDHLPLVVFSYNSSAHYSTGLSPYRAMFGRDPNLPSQAVLSKRPSRHTWNMENWIDQLPSYLVSVWSNIRSNTKKAQQKMAKFYDKNRKRVSIIAGDRVWLFRPELLSGKGHKFALPYEGPHDVLRVNSNGSVLIRRTGLSEDAAITVNADRLSKCRPIVPRNT